MILKMKRFKTLSLLMSLFVCVSIFSNMSIKVLADVAQSGNLITNGTFEDGTTNGWGTNASNVVLSATTDDKASGTHSMKVTGRQDSWQGPTFDLKNKLTKGTTYNVSLKVKVVKGQAAAGAANTNQLVSVTMFRQETGATQGSYDSIAYQQTVNEEAWTTITGTYTPTFDSYQNLNLYLESPNKTLQFYVDDVLVTPNLITNGTFEDGTTTGWSGNAGNVVLTATQDDKASGSYSMKVTGRADTWQGPTFDLKNKLTKGTTYNVSLKVKVVKGQAAAGATDTNQVVSVSMYRLEDGATQPNFDSIAYQKTVNEESWTTITGTYTPTSDSSQTLNLYVESPNKTLQFYVDDVNVYNTSLDSVSNTNNSNSNSTTNLVEDGTFEDGTTTGWSPRGTAKLEATTEDSASGSHSMKVTGRTDTWNGPAVHLYGKVQIGSKYNVSLKVKALPGQSGTKAVNISTEKTVAGTQGWNNLISGVAITDSSWTTINTELSLVDATADMTELDLYVESSNKTLEFYVDDVSVTKETTAAALPVQTDIPSLKDVFKDYFTLGGEVEPPLITPGSLSEQLVSKHYGMLVAGNEMKPDWIEHVKGTFNYADADKIINYAIDHNLPMRGHTLVWHAQVPAWMFQDPTQTKQATHDELIANETQYITDVLTRFTKTYGTADGNTANGLNPTGKVSPIKCWDAVNEVISDDGNPNSIFRLDTNAPWYEIAGEDYIKTAFNVAHSIDPSLKLFINDYGTEANGAKTDKLYNVVKDLKAQGVPIGGIGMQMHISTNTDINAVKASIEKFASLGVEVQITELDMAVANKPINEAGYEKQARVYKQLFDVLKLEAQKKNIKTVMFWGVSDADSWIPDGDPLLFNRQFQAKDAYYAIADASKAVVDRQNTKIQEGTATSADDAVWKTVSSFNTGVYVKGASGATAGVKALWDNQNLYLKINVDDTTVGNNDSVDIYLDKKDDKATTYQTDDQHITVKRSDCVSDSNGYTVFKTIPISDVKPAVGNTLGFDIRVNDDQGKGSVDAQTVWNDYGNRQDTNTAYFGDLTLSDAASLTTAAYGTPTIDGTIDDVWSKANSVNTNTWVQGTSGATAKVRTLWDNNNLYVLAEVTDSLLNKASANPWEQDSVEVFLDQNNHKTSAYENDDYQIRVNYDNEVSSGSTGLPTGFKSATSKTSTGYIVEEVIPLSAVTPEGGSVLGFDVQVNNADDSGKRVSVATWCDPTGNSWASTANFGYLVLADSRPLPVVSANIKGGLYNATQTISLTSSIDADIYYTLDGTDPTTSSTKFTSPITINKDTVLKYFAVSKLGRATAVSTESYIIDTKAPVITITGVNNSEIYITSVTPVISVDDSTATVTKLLNDKPYDGSEIKDNGQYVLKVTAVDKAGNSSVKTISFSINKATAPATKPASSNAKDVLSAITSAQSGANVEVTIDSNNPKADESIFAQLKGQDKSVSFEGNGITWTFNGKDITKDLKSIDLSVNIADAKDSTSSDKAAILAKVKDASAKVISFAPNGVLPGPATVKINLGSGWAGKSVFFYYYNPATDKTELVADSVTVDSNGILTVTITHNSDFIATTTKLADASATTTTTTSGTSGTSSTPTTTTTTSSTSSTSSSSSTSSTSNATTTSTSLPKTGSPIDFNVLVLVGFIFLGTGIYALRKKKLI